MHQSACPMCTEAGALLRQELQLFAKKAFRDELESFAQSTLKRNLEELRSQIHKDIHDAVSPTADHGLHSENEYAVSASSGNTLGVPSPDVVSMAPVANPMLAALNGSASSPRGAKGAAHFPAEGLRSNIIHVKPAKEEVCDLSTLSSHTAQDERPRPHKKTSFGDSFADENTTNTKGVRHVSLRSQAASMGDTKSSTGDGEDDMVGTQSSMRWILQRAQRASTNATRHAYFQSSGVVGAFGERNRKMCLAMNFEDTDKFLPKFLRISSKVLEHTISIVIILNGIFIGVQVDHQARVLTESVPRVFSVMEVCFFAVFFFEWTIKLAVFRLRFFYMTGWGWNMFDSMLVAIQAVEVLGMLTSGHESDSNSESASVGMADFNILRVLRILRLFRILRLVRLFQFVTELRTIVDSISNSLRPFVWTVLVFVLVIYMVAIVFTQLVFSHRVGEANKDFPVLDRWWGSLGRSALTLYQSILNGVDWEDCVYPLSIEISPIMNVVFSAYIAFTSLALMNIITGTFVQSALDGAEKAKTKDFGMTVVNLFNGIEEDETGVISLRDFECLLTLDTFKRQMKFVGVSEVEARLLFKHLDHEGIGFVELSQLVDNIIRLHQGAKYIDTMKLMMYLDQESFRARALQEENVNRVMKRMDHAKPHESCDSQKQMKVSTPPLRTQGDTSSVKSHARSANEKRLRLAASSDDGLIVDDVG